MNELDHAQFERLRQKQLALQAQLDALAGEIERLRENLVTTPVSVAPQPAPAATVTPVNAQDFANGASSTRAVPAPLPPVIHIEPEALHPHPTPGMREWTQPVPAVEPIAAAAPATPERSSFEMRVGTYWLVRVGIVMLLTGLVFLGTYAYKNFIGRLGAGGKVTLLYAAGAALLGAGAWLQRRREKEGVRNYGQVLFAGGLATVYFTTYAAHYIPVLRVIASPVVDGVLLLAWGAVIAAIADWRKSEVLAVFGVGLAYYASAMTDVRLFTLYSNLILTAAAVYFLLRQRWVTLSFLAIGATYGSFAFWRFYHGDWNWDARTDLGPANGFLAGYWVLFTAAVFFSRSGKLRDVTRALFAGANNGAFFGLVLLSMMHAHGHFWQFACGFGSVLLGCAGAAKRFLGDEPAVRNAYLVQGIVLVTMGFIAYFSGLQLALVLAAETGVLTFFAGQRANPWLRALACICGLLSATWVGMRLLPGFDPQPWVAGAGIGALLGFAAWCEHRAEPQAGSPMRGFTAYFSLLALFAWAVTTWQHVPETWLPLAFAAEALGLTASLYLIGIPEVAVASQLYLVTAQCVWLYRTLQHDETLTPWWSAAGIIAATVALSHWWQREKQLDAHRDVRSLFQVVYGSAVVAILFLWLKPHFGPPTWLAFANLLAVGLTLYAILTRSWILAVCSQAFVLVGAWEFAHQLISGKPEWYFALVPAATWLALGTVTAAWLTRRNQAGAGAAPLFQASVFYQWVALAMSFGWMFVYFPPQFHFCSLVAAGTLLLALAAWRKTASPLPFAWAYFIAAGAVLAVQLLNDPTNALHWLNALALVAVFAVQRLVRRFSSRVALPAPAHDTVIVAAAALLWLYVSRWVMLTAGGGHMLTVSWAALAFVLFGGGFLLRERMYRWFGLAMLASSVGRVFLFDVWRLEIIYRILSFMALGIVLLVLGFIYNKYQDKIRQWL